MRGWLRASTVAAGLGLAAAGVSMWLPDRMCETGVFVLVFALLMEGYAGRRRSLERRRRGRT